VYELVTINGVALLDDSTGAHDQVEARFPWKALDSARVWEDSLRVLRQSLAESSDYAYELRYPRTGDVNEAGRRILKWMSCVEWQVGVVVTLESNGQFTNTQSNREYCRGATPAYTRSTHSTTATLGPCERGWQAPIAGMVRHLTCTQGALEGYAYSYSQAGDTLWFKIDCDGTEKYVLRQPQAALGAVASARAYMRTMDDC
jgi:hypothetical protein